MKIQHGLGGDRFPNMLQAGSKTERQRCMRALSMLRKFWLGLRAITGDDAYERYLAHWSQHHEKRGGTPLGRQAFFRQEIERKWNGVRRCC